MANTAPSYIYGKNELADMAIRIQEYINSELENFKITHIKLAQDIVISDIELDINVTRGPYYTINSVCNGVKISLAI